MSNALFPTLPGLTWDVVKSPRWNTRVQQSVGGKEIRAQFYARPLWQWQLKYERLLGGAAGTELQTLVGFFHARQGKFDSFLFSDPADNAVTAHGFGVGDGTTTQFQLQRTLAGPRQIDAISGVCPTSSTPRTNLFPYSEDLGAGPNFYTSASSTQNAVIAPDGNFTADKLVEAAASGTDHTVYRAPSLLDNTTYTYSLFLRQLERVWARVQVVNKAGVAVFRYINLVTGALGSGTATVTVSPAPTGYWRLQLPYNASAGGTAPIISVSIATSDGGNIYTGDGTSGIALWGQQHEIASAATPYIPTTSSAVAVAPSYFPGSADGFEPVTDLYGIPTVFIAGVQKTLNSDFTVSSTGLVTFSTAPAAGAALTWNGVYFWRVRFDQDAADFTNFLYQLWELKQLTLVSVK